MKRKDSEKSTAKDACNPFYCKECKMEISQYSWEKFHSEHFVVPLSLFRKQQLEIWIPKLTAAEQNFILATLELNDAHDVLNKNLKSTNTDELEKKLLTCSERAFKLEFTKLQQENREKQEILEATLDKLDQIKVSVQTAKDSFSELNKVLGKRKGTYIEEGIERTPSKARLGEFKLLPNDFNQRTKLGNEVAFINNPCFDHSGQIFWLGRSKNSNQAIFILELNSENSVVSKRILNWQKLRIDGSRALDICISNIGLYAVLENEKGMKEIHSLFSSNLKTCRKLPLEGSTLGQISTWRLLGCDKYLVVLEIDSNPLKIAVYENNTLIHTQAIEKQINVSAIFSTITISKELIVITGDLGKKLLVIKWKNMDKLLPNFLQWSFDLGETELVSIALVNFLPKSYYLFGVENANNNIIKVYKVRSDYNSKGVMEGTELNPYQEIDVGFRCNFVHFMPSKDSLIFQQANPRLIGVMHINATLLKD